MPGRTSSGPYMLAVTRRGETDTVRRYVVSKEAHSFNYYSIMPSPRISKYAIMSTTAILALPLLFAISRHYYKEASLSRHTVSHCSNLSVKSRKLWSGTNTLVVFTGRWRFLRILFPYVYRELRRNGGVLDRVVFMMMNYDNHTLEKMTELIRAANNILEEEVFKMDFMGFIPRRLPPFNKKRFSSAYYEMFSGLVNNSSNRYFKIDDDIVYIHPGTFGKMIKSKNTNCCFVHFANIVSNWRCNIKHQELGIYNSLVLNPKRLKFEQGIFPNCGWKSLECAELTLKTFLINYHQKQLDRYLFKGLELLRERQRFSIQFHMLDRDLIDVKTMLKAGPLGSDDEVWWTISYSPKFRELNCIVGDSLVVHFSYGPTYNELLQTGLLSEFESIVQKEIATVMDERLWKVLNFSKCETCMIQL